MRMDLAVIEGAPPLGPDDLLGLKLASVTTQADLNEAEQANILKAVTWARRTSRNVILSRDYVAELHRRMFSDVWRWAGTWRHRQTNIGVAPNAILVGLEQMFCDVRYWTDNATFDVDEIAVRLHHRMVSIHPFPNGNGRHSRLAADIFRGRHGRPWFTWGGGPLSATGDLRRRYIDALRHADQGEIRDLLAFAHS